MKTKDGKGVSAVWFMETVKVPGGLVPGRR